MLTVCHVITLAWARGRERLPPVGVPAPREIT